VIPTSNREEESAFSLGFCKLRFPRSGRNGGQEHFFNKLLGQMMTILTEFGVESRIENEDYLQGLRNLQKVW
ncbi:MAG: hypothetical protein ACYC92_15640, partial [Candidatus Acidiferrales bacterium]